MERRTPEASAVETTHLVLPPDTNAHGTASGGRIMEWMDITASIAAGRHCRQAAVTANVDDLTLLCGRGAETRLYTATPLNGPS